MHKIEQAIQAFLEDIENVQVPDALIEEFGERCKNAIRQCLLSKRSEEPFKLRMSNIGKPLRQLMLEQTYGRGKLDAQTRVKMTYGFMYESFLMFLLKASGLQIETNTKVKLEVGYGLSRKVEVINGELDLKFDGLIYDVKSASSWAYDNKFISFDILSQSDDFGYCGQALGYSLADKSRFGGWIVIDKSDGRIKVIECPQDNYKELARRYLDDFKNKIEVIHSGYLPADIDRIAPCTGVVEETFNRVTTGNFYLNKSCEFCNCKYKCHPELVRAEVPMSKAKNKVWRYYTKLVKPND